MEYIPLITLCLIVIITIYKFRGYGFDYIGKDTRYCIRCDQKQVKVRSLRMKSGHYMNEWKAAWPTKDVNCHCHGETGVPE